MGAGICVEAGTKTISFAGDTIGENLTLDKVLFYDKWDIICWDSPLASKFSPLSSLLVSNWPLLENPDVEKAYAHSVNSLALATEASLEDDDYKQCKHKVMSWASSSLNSESDDNKYELRDILFFLHVPRTGGRTYNICLLQKMNLNSRECAPSYDQFRFKPSKETKCRLLSSHDDYSVMSKLPKERTSVMTMIRNPIERVFGTFEFSVAMASKYMKHDNITSAMRIRRVVASNNNTSAGQRTLDIWPWKYLIPLMHADLCARRDARELRGEVILANDNPYDMEDFLMPLRDYIYDPVVRDLVHNGATFQIAGLTNNSIFEEAHEARHCVMKYQDLGKFVLEVAKKRLDNMLFVGLTEKHKESASMLAKIVGPQVISRKEASSSQSQLTEQSSLHLRNTKSVADNHRNITYQRASKVHRFPNKRPARGNMTVEELIERYGTCASTLKKSQSVGWEISLKRISNDLNFTKKTRRLVPEEVIKEIASLNSLDVELHNYAQQIFAKQQQRFSKSTEDDNPTHESLSATTLVYICGAQPSFIILLVVFIAGFLLLLFRFHRMSSKVRRRFKERREHIT